jgi:hypothetical protein
MTVSTQPQEEAAIAAGSQEIIGSEILLYPDTGPEFLRALKMAVLYSQRVHVLTLIDKPLIESFLANPIQQAQAAESTHSRHRMGDGRVPILTGGVPTASTDAALSYLGVRSR